MTVRGAVLRAMGLPAPYAQSQPLRIEELQLGGPFPKDVPTTPVVIQSAEILP